ncbi:metal ABC transporter permease [Roseiconus lacunae]|uniref:Metal ABC transporter permease n=1 Tax=Roseiconus lacunae TaxID=2605694 RepID=A0ABT7PMJ5_9BACT|nr:metal ABC transporter permease [Roseiconus lacunae]MCD0460873.1 metal ABC transporter permease [Roseiconus lacunae]MDM4017371.1 metal ABC transporter permease [Roseiconus lacunae]WRQ48718.1 metal ABC transporter permease [Stieleria sp. HD01]
MINGNALSLLAIQWSWSLDGWIVLVGALAAVSSALLGNFLVLRRMSMLGDAITHAVLPGIAAAFFITQSRDSLTMFLGAVVVGILTAFFTEWIRTTGNVDEGASMGVVFTSLFALGLVLLVQTADNVDLDPYCVLYGAIELTPLDTVNVFGHLVPRAAMILGAVTIINIVFVIAFFKELRLTSFDPALATTMGYSAKWMHYVLMVLVSVTAVASFESVGSILVVAMFVVPPAAAYMLTDRMGIMILISAIVAACSSMLGHVMAISVPTWFGFGSTTTAGMIAVATGIFFVFAATFSPTHGVLVKAVRRQVLSLTILCDDIVAYLFRAEEIDHRTPTPGEVQENLLTTGTALRLAIRMLRRSGELQSGTTSLELTKTGRRRGQRLVRSHRLWEQYLVDRAGRGTDRIHDQAERFEHFTDRELRERLSKQTDAPKEDPHGRPIPDEHE